MSIITDPTSPTDAAPRRERARLWWLVFGILAAPAMWTLQFLLGYGFSSETCYPGYEPSHAAPGGLRGLLIAFDAIAIVVALAAAVASWRVWTSVRDIQGQPPLVAASLQRSSFLALWGLLTSMGFLATILFATLGSVVVPLCGQ